MTGHSIVTLKDSVDTRAWCDGGHVAASTLYHVAHAYTERNNATTPRGASVRCSHDAPTLFGNNHHFSAVVPSQNHPSLGRLPTKIPRFSLALIPPVDLFVSFPSLVTYLHHNLFRAEGF